MTFAPIHVLNTGKNITQFAIRTLSSMFSSPSCQYSPGKFQKIIDISPYLTLNNGRKIPQLAFGTFDAPGDQMDIAIDFAIEAGYRHFDCAAYHQNEKHVGEALAKAMKMHNLKRKDLFITSKLWSDKHDPKDVRPACEESLNDLGVGYLDLYLMHFPMAFQYKPGVPFDINDPNCLIYEDIPYVDTWRAMEKLVPAGLTKSVGVSNFNHKQIERVIETGTIVPAVNQVEMNLHCLNTKLIEFCHSKGIQVEGYAPFGSPGFMKLAKSLFEEPVVVEIAKKHKKTPSQVLLRHGIQHNVVVISKSVNPERIILNSQIFDFVLSNKEMERLNNAGEGKRIFHIPAYAKHPDYPYNEEY